MKLTVYWHTADKRTVDAIRQKFNIPRYTSVNGETTAEIEESLMPLLLECEKRGFIQIRKK